jgi:hypothetical protein
LIHFTFALGLVLAGGSAWGPWLLELLAMAMAGWLSFRLYRPIHGRAVAWSVTLIWMLSLASLLERGGYTEPFTLPLQFGGLLVFLKWVEEPEVRRWPMLLGVLAGGAFLYRQNHIGIFVVSFVVAMLLGGRARSPGAWLRGMSSVLLGLFTVWLPFAVYFSVHDAWSEFWDAAFHYNFLYTSISQTDRWGTFVFAIERIPWSYVILPMWAGLVVRTLRTRSLHPGARTSLLCVALAALPLEYYLSSASIKRYPHYFIICLPVLSILLAELFAAAQRLPGRVPRHQDLARVALPVLILASLLSLDFGKLVKRYEAAADPLTDSGYRRAIQFVEQNSNPDQTALVWGADPVILALADRRSPSRFSWLYPLMARGFHLDRITREFVDDVRANPPAVIVDTAHPYFVDLDARRREPVELPNTVEARSLGPMSPIIEEFLDMVDREYVLTESFDHVDVYVRRSEES